MPRIATTASRDTARSDVRGCMQSCMHAYRGRRISNSVESELDASRQCEYELAELVRGNWTSLAMRSDPDERVRERWGSALASSASRKP